MIINASFWVAASFFIFFGLLIYLKIPNKINSSLDNKINEIKKELEESKKLKEEAKKLLSLYEDKIDNAFILLDYDNGVKVNCEVSWLTPMKIRKLMNFLVQRSLMLLKE